MFIKQGLGYHHLTRCVSLLIAQAPVDASSASNGNILEEISKEVARDNRVLSLLIFGVKSKPARFKGSLTVEAEKSAMLLVLYGVSVMKSAWQILVKVNCIPTSGVADSAADINTFTLRVYVVNAPRPEIISKM